MEADEILKKHEDANEMHFHEVDRKWIIEAMEEYAALRQPLVSGSLPPDEKFFELTEKICYQQFAADPMGDIVAKMSLIKQFINEQCLGGNDR